jgi:hypothetical protein
MNQVGETINSMTNPPSISSTKLENPAVVIPPLSDTLAKLPDNRTSRPAYRDTYSTAVRAVT